MCVGGWKWGASSAVLKRVVIDTRLKDVYKTHLMFQMFSNVLKPPDELWCYNSLGFFTLYPGEGHIHLICFHIPVASLTSAVSVPTSSAMKRGRRRPKCQEITVRQQFFQRCKSTIISNKTHINFRNTATTAPCFSRWIFHLEAKLVGLNTCATNWTHNVQFKIKLKQKQQREPVIILFVQAKRK